MAATFPFPWITYRRFATDAEMQAELDADTFVELDTDAALKEFEGLVWAARYKQRLDPLMAEDRERPVDQRHGYAPGKPLEYRRGQLVWGTWKTLEAKPHSDGLGGGIVRLRRSVAVKVDSQATLALLLTAETTGAGPKVPEGTQVGDWLVRRSARYEGLLDGVQGVATVAPAAAAIDGEPDAFKRQLLVVGARVDGRTLARTRPVDLTALPRKTRAQLSERGLASATFYYEGLAPLVVSSGNEGGGGALQTIVVALASAGAAAGATWYALSAGAAL